MEYNYRYQSDYYTQPQITTGQSQYPPGPRMRYNQSWNQPQTTTDQGQFPSPSLTRTLSDVVEIQGDVVKYRKGRPPALQMQDDKAKSLPRAGTVLPDQGQSRLPPGSRPWSEVVGGTRAWYTSPGIRRSSHQGFVQSGRQVPAEPQPLEQPRRRADTYSESTQQIRGQESGRPRSYQAGDKPRTKQKQAQRAPLQAEGSVLSGEQQATRQLGGETAADITTTQRVSPQSTVNANEQFPPREMSGRPRVHPQGTLLSGDQWSGRPYSYQAGDTPAVYPKDLKPIELKGHQTRRGKWLCGVAVLASVLLVVLLAYFCGYKKVCGPSNVIISSVATVSPKPRATPLSSTVIIIKKADTELPIQGTVSRCEDDTCGENQQCDDTSFPPSCNCLPGYNGASCKDDIDECKQVQCSVDEVCDNTPGSYSCLPRQEKPHAPAPKPRNRVGVITLIALFASGAAIIVLMTIYLVYKITKQTQRR